MNPLFWSGGKFLLLYLAVAAIVLAFVSWRTRGRDDAGTNITAMTADPYRIAFLRAGAKEAIRIAVFNLVDRGLLDLRPDGHVFTARKDAESLVRRPLDRAILATCLRPATPASLLGRTTLVEKADEHGPALEREGLLPDEAARRTRIVTVAIAVGILAGLAALKAVVALSQGRTNLLFLALLAFFACVAAVYVGGRRQTVSGKAMLADLRTLTARLHRRAEELRPGGATSEALLLASVLGLSALPATSFPYADALYPRPRADGGDSGGSSSDSDGGSGCGGGCGGCGGD